jgi:hypothetical protein
LKPLNRVGEPLTEAEEIRLEARYPPDPNDPLNGAMEAWNAITADRRGPQWRGKP